MIPGVWYGSSYAESVSQGCNREADHDPARRKAIRARRTFHLEREGLPPRKSDSCTVRHALVIRKCILIIIYNEKHYFLVRDTHDEVEGTSQFHFELALLTRIFSKRISSGAEPLPAPRGIRVPRSRVTFFLRFLNTESPALCAVNYEIPCIYIPTQLSFHVFISEERSCAQSRGRLICCLVIYYFTFERKSTDQYFHQPRIIGQTSIYLQLPWKRRIARRLYLPFLESVNAFSSPLLVFLIFSLFFLFLVSFSVFSLFIIIIISSSSSSGSITNFFTFFFFFFIIRTRSTQL